MEKIKSGLIFWGQRLISGWGVMKILRISLPVLVLVVAWNNQDILIAIMGGMMLLIALFNLGRCYACDINQPAKRLKSLSKPKEETTFTELK